MGFIEEIDEKVFSDFEKIKEHENDIFGVLPNTNEELANLFEELNDKKDEKRKKIKYKNQRAKWLI